MDGVVSYETSGLEHGFSDRVEPAPASQKKKCDVLAFEKRRCNLIEILQGPHAAVPTSSGE